MKAYRALIRHNVARLLETSGLSADAAEAKSGVAVGEVLSGWHRLTAGEGSALAETIGCSMDEFIERRR